jgi:hypothetical protein
MITKLINKNINQMTQVLIFLQLVIVKKKIKDI